MSRSRSRSTARRLSATRRIEDPLVLRSGLHGTSMSIGDSERTISVIHVVPSFFLVVLDEVVVVPVLPALLEVTLHQGGGSQEDRVADVVSEAGDVFTTSYLLDALSVGVGAAVAVTETVAHHQDCFDRLQRNVADAAVHRGEDVAETVERVALLCEVADSVHGGGGGRVGNDPDGLAADFKLQCVDVADDRGKETSLHDRDDLLISSSTRVGDEPADLFADLSRDPLLQQRGQEGENTLVDDDLSHFGVGGGEVAEGADGGEHDGFTAGAKKIHDERHHTVIHHSVDARRGSVAEIGNGPARIVLDFGDRMGEKALDGGNTRLDRVKVGRGLVSAELGQEPDGVSQRGDVVVVPVEAGEEGVHDTGREDLVANGRAVASHVAEAPCGLLSELLDGILEEADEFRDGAAADDDVGVGGGAGGDVGERPGGVELDVGIGGVEEGDELLDSSVACEVSEGRALGVTEKAADRPDATADDVGRVARVHHTAEISDLRKHGVGLVDEALGLLALKLVALGVGELLSVSGGGIAVLLVERVLVAGVALLSAFLELFEAVLFAEGDGLIDAAVGALLGVEGGLGSDRLAGYIYSRSFVVSHIFVSFSVSKGSV